MNITNIINIIIGILVLFSTILSIANFVSTMKKMKTTEKIANHYVKQTMDKYLKNSSNISLKEICEGLVNYFEKISKNNKCTVSIYKINNDNMLKKVSSSSEFNTNTIYNIKDSIEFYEVSNTLKPYYINDVEYFNERENKNLNFKSNFTDRYQSIICYPLKSNNTIVGFLTIHIKKPLNDLINVNDIMQFLQKQCEVIVHHNEFIKFDINT